MLELYLPRFNAWRPLEKKIDPRIMSQLHWKDRTPQCNTKSQLVFCGVTKWTLRADRGLYICNLDPSWVLFICFERYSNACYCGSIVLRGILYTLWYMELCTQWFPLHLCLNVLDDLLICQSLSTYLTIIFSMLNYIAIKAQRER